MPEPEKAVEGYTKAQLKKIGKYPPEVFATYNPKTSKDVFAGTQKVPNAIEVENQYDADKDSRKLW